MILFPAIDLKDGACVRLRQGDMGRATVFPRTPAEQARHFEELGFSWLHIVDLNGAFSGRSENAEAVEAILASVSLPVQLGGGIRDMAAIEAWLDKGVSRVILGTAAAKDPDLVKAAAKAFPGKVAVGIDAREGLVAVEGWSHASQITVFELAQRFEDADVAALIHTDIQRDGMLTGLNLEQTIALAETVEIPVIASGGLAGMDDIDRLASPEASVLGGAIAGRALYDGRLDPAAALARLRRGPVQ